MEEIALASAALALLEKLAPILEDKIKTGEVSVTEQQDVRDKYLSFRQKFDGAFSGPEWQTDPEPDSPAPDSQG